MARTTWVVYATRVSSPCHPQQHHHHHLIIIIINSGGAPANSTMCRRSVPRNTQPHRHTAGATLHTRTCSCTQQSYLGGPFPPRGRGAAGATGATGATAILPCHTTTHTTHTTQHKQRVLPRHQQHYRNHYECGCWCRGGGWWVCGQP